MFSVIIYGRNDSHGYNLHKRAAISFNALAEVMSDPDDEILFVDYNTPDDHPTFPEAIHDTLTDKAKKVMRILRVRPEQHVHLKARTHLVALEAQSRNVALRRSNPRNRWILYTNTDMLLVPRNEGESLERHPGRPSPMASTRCRDSRFPEMLWEAAFDRRDPAGNLAKLRDWSVRFHLNQVVHNYMPMKYDALGDFQAALREDMFAIHGFDEDDDPGLALRFQPGGAACALSRQGRHADRQGVRISLRSHARRRGQQQGPRNQDERPGSFHLERVDALPAGAGRQLGLAGCRDRGGPP